MAFLKLTEQNVQGKTVLIRADMNVPFKDGNISDDTRIRASLASIKYCLDNGASVIVMTHLGRPTEGEFHPEDDVAPVAAHLGKLLGKDVKVLNDWRENKPTLNAGDVVMLQTCASTKARRKTTWIWAKPTLLCATCSLTTHSVLPTAPKLRLKPLPKPHRLPAPAC